MAIALGFSGSLFAEEINYAANAPARAVGASIAIKQPVASMPLGNMYLEAPYGQGINHKFENLNQMMDAEDWAPSILPSKPVLSERSLDVAELSSPIELGELITEIDNGWTASVHRAPEEIPIGTRFLADANLAAADGEDGDPLETVNRFMFGFNEYLQDYAMRPIAHAYNDYFPAMVRQAVGNFLTNLSSPVTLANDVLQLEFYRAWDTFVRIVVNSTAGIGGLADVATGMGFEEHEEDFGQTLGSYGVEEMVYLVLPIFGPSSPRDVVGKFVVDPYFDIAGYWIDNNEQTELGYARTGVGALDEYADIVNELEQIKKTSVDFYAAVRSLYRQKREKEIANGSRLDLPPIPDYDLNLSPKNSADPIAGAD